MANAPAAAMEEQGAVGGDAVLHPSGLKSSERCVQTYGLKTLK